MNVREGDSHLLSRPTPLEESPVIFGDHIQRRIRWSRPGFLPTDLMRFDRLAERPIRLRFVMKDANIYSFRFK